MSNKPFDFEAERNRMAKELGLTYSDNGKAVFWQENMQAQEAKRELTEILANERKPNRTSAFEETPNSAQEPVPESSAARRDFDQPRSYQEADDTCDAIYSQGRTTESQSEQTAGVSMAKEHSKLSLKLRMKSMFNRFQGFAQSRKERSQASGVAAQQKEKKKQVQTAVAGLTVVFVLVTGAMIVAGDERRARPEPCDPSHRHDGYARTKESGNVRDCFGAEEGTASCEQIQGQACRRAQSSQGISLGFCRRSEARSHGRVRRFSVRPRRLA